MNLYLLEIEQEYEKPKYDPWDVFKPSKSFLKEVIRSLKQQAYASLQDIEQLESFNNPLTGAFALYEQERHRKICKRIQEYEWRLNSSASKNSEIGPDRILLAKGSPIQDYYSGKLRRLGKTLVGRCPFHDEKTASFTIYTDRNRFVCFGCGEKGDTIHFVQKTQSLKFPEAVKLILHL